MVALYYSIEVLCSAEPTLFDIAPSFHAGDYRATFRSLTARYSLLGAMCGI